MLLDAIVLAGGRSSRLSGEPKAELIWRGESLLQRTVDAAAAAGCRRIVVVGPDAGLPSRRTGTSVITVREQPAFAGPAAAIGAGMSTLLQWSDSAADAVLVLACDMPAVSEAVAVLLASASAPVGPAAGRRGAGESLPGDGVVLIDAGGRRQPLAAVYRCVPLAAAVRRLRGEGRLEGGSITSLIADLDLREQPDPEGWTRDVDTWDDAALFGITRAEAAKASGSRLAVTPATTPFEDEKKDDRNGHQ